MIVELALEIAEKMLADYGTHLAIALTIFLMMALLLEVIGVE